MKASIYVTINPVSVEDRNKLADRVEGDLNGVVTCVGGGTDLVTGEADIDFEVTVDSFHELTGIGADVEEALANHGAKVLRMSLVPESRNNG